MSEQKISTLQKLKVLAERGVPGEKDNAKLLLEKLCKKYGLSVDDSIPDERKIHWFAHKRDSFSDRLLCQCIYKILGYERQKQKYTHTIKGKHIRSEIGVECNAAEAIEIELDYTFYYNHLKNEFERFYDMFIQKNSIFPPDDKAAPITESREKELTKEDIELYQGIKKQSRVLQITGGKR